MSRSKIGVVFDSSAYAPKPLEHTRVVELRVNKGDRSYKELTEIDWDEINELLDEGNDNVIGIWLSKHFSVTFEEAKMLESEFIGRFIALDTKLVAAGPYRMILEALKAIDLGWSLDEVVNHVIEVRDAYQTIFLASIEHLAKGGRIGKAQALAGNLLHFQPLLFVDDGMVNSYKVVRGRKAAIKEMPQFMIKNFGHEQLFLDIVWSDNFDEVRVLEQLRTWGQIFWHCLVCLQK